MEPRRLKERIREAAGRAGFTAVGVSRAGHLAEDRIGEWIARGYQGEMAYLERGLERRADPGRVLSGAQSVISLGLDYHPGWDPPAGDPTQGSISRYAVGRDYHKVLVRRMKLLLEELRRTISGLEARISVDTGPVAEKLWASRGGLGWIGKHTNLISRSRGSWFFLGEIFTNQAVEPDLPSADYCGTCTRCIDACPTQAIVEPYVLDATRCISYLTIEHRSGISEELRPQMGNLIFGCDICQEVCPWNQKSRVTGDPEFREKHPGYALKELSRLSPERFSVRFQGSPVRRAKWSGFQRNVAVAMGNSGNRDFIAELDRLRQSGDTLVEEHASWALERLD